MSESPQDRPLITCPGCKKDVWPHNEMTVSGGFQDKCPTSGCGTNLSHLMTDAHRAGHKTTKPIRTEPVEPEPPLTASGVASALAEALKAAGLLPVSVEERAAPVASGEQTVVPCQTAAPFSPQPGNVYLHPAPTNWEPVGGGGLGPTSPRQPTTAEYLYRVIRARVHAIYETREVLAVEQSTLTELLADMESHR